VLYLLTTYQSIGIILPTNRLVGKKATFMRLRMPGKSEITTKDKILKAAARLFSEKGYNEVTTRQIAKAIGINSASIYYHFPSKEDILRGLYKYYSKSLREKCPNLEELLRLAETEPPHEVLKKTEFHFDDDIREMLDQILVASARRLGSDAENERFIRENLFNPIMCVVKPLLERMVELGKIKPLDIEAFLSVMSYFCFSAAALNQSSFGLSVKQYQAAMYFMFSLIVPMGGGYGCETEF